MRNCSTLNTVKMDSLEDCFIGKEDNHNGIIVDSIREPCSADVISKRLRGIIMHSYECILHVSVCVYIELTN